MGVLTTAADIAVVATMVYFLLRSLKGTQAVSLLNGLLILYAANLLAGLLRLEALAWLLKQVTTMAIVGIPVVFQPEIRRALDQLGRGKIFAASLRGPGLEETERVLREVARAAEAMSRDFIGALIVIERATGTGEITESGVKLDALVSAELLVNVFSPHTPLHDGAVVIRGNRILAAACVLPLSEAHSSGTKLGTRHRAALGMSERTDAVMVVVSEETGGISLASEGQLHRDLGHNEMRERLRVLFGLDSRERKFWRPRGRSRGRAK
jgi:diadenylate cyclase